MKVQVFSDIHAEAFRGRNAPIWNLVHPQADVAVVAGDIDSRDFEKTCSEIASKFKKVFVVFGNHEFYHRDIDWRPDMSKMPANVTILDRTAEEYEGKLFIGCTLWTDFKNRDWFVVNRADSGITDFHAITANNGGTRYTAAMAYEKHLIDKSWLKTMIEQNRGKDLVIVTHFMPSYECVDPMWKNATTDTLNYYFSAGCDDLLEVCEAKAWICGHTHCPIDGMELGSTKVYCNPLGYGAGSERLRYNQPVTDVIIEV